jgi:hypothetical protein
VMAKVNIRLAKASIAQQQQQNLEGEHQLCC